MNAFEGIHHPVISLAVNYQFNFSKPMKSFP